MDRAQMEQIKKMKQLLNTAEGKKLLKLLSKDGGGALKQAGAALQQGDTAQVQNLMGPMVDSPEVQKLLASLEQNMNG